MKIQHIHAHFDDFEFYAGGLFTICRQRLGDAFTGQVVVCTDGRAGHHELGREETGRVRLAEQRESARIGRYDFHHLTLPDGSVPREACLEVTVPLCAAIWRSIRAFGPDYVLCPPVVGDPLCGIHVDHVAVAEAVRRVAYMINVPHAFTPEYPEAPPERCVTPVILTVYDAYGDAGQAFDLAIDAEDGFDIACEMAWAHRSQVVEWLPWVAAPARWPVPRDLADWKRIRRGEIRARNAALGIDSDRLYEFFSVTSWGMRPDVDRLLRELPGIDRERSRLDALRRRSERRKPG